jgi:hypothetical protein
MRNALKVELKNVEGRAYLRDISVDEEIMLNRVLENT